MLSRNETPAENAAASSTCNKLARVTINLHRLESPRYPSHGGSLPSDIPSRLIQRSQDTRTALLYTASTLSHMDSIFTAIFFCWRTNIGNTEQNNSPAFIRMRSQVSVKVMRSPSLCLTVLAPQTGVRS